MSQTSNSEDPGTCPDESWWRFSRYQIKDGFIGPAEGASLQTYDPWRAYAESREKGDVSSPYQSLVDTLRHVTFRLDSSGTPVLMEAAEARVLAWCNEYGLLGILPHRALAITPAPFVIVVPKEPASGAWGARWDEEGKDVAAIGLDWWEYFHCGARWQGRLFDETLPFSQAGSLPRRLREEGIVSADAQGYLSSGRLGLAAKYRSQLPPGSETMPVVGALIRSVAGPDVEHCSIEDAMSPYFPTVPEAERDVFRYPEPLSESFWALYAEPVQEFVWAGGRIGHLLDQMYSLEEVSDNPVIQAGLVARRKLYGGTTEDISQQLETLSEDCREVAVREAPGCWTKRRMFSSLIGALATMVQEDLDAGCRPERCKECGSAFLTSAYQAKYCSVRCRNTAQQRRYRAKRRSGTGSTESERRRR